MACPAWNAPTAGRPVEAVVDVPGSKSLTNRALVLAALADGRSVLRRPLRSRDTLLMAAGLRALGVGVADDGDDWAVAGVRCAPKPTGAPIDVGNAGTVARFLPPVATLAIGGTRFDGDARARERPLGPLLSGLRALGARIDGDALPLTVHGGGRLAGGAVTLDASPSSQFVSGLLLTAPRFDDGLDLRHAGAPVPSARQIAMTVDMLRVRGVAVDDAEQDRWIVRPSPLAACDTEIEPDLSSAAPFLAAAAATGGTVRVPGWPASSNQPGVRLPELLSAMGATCVLDATGLTVRGPDRLTGVHADLRDASELVPVLTALAALAATPSRLRGIAHMRLHETDRLAALAGEIGGLGGDVREADDGLDVRPKSLHGGLFRSHDDHRLVMAAAVLGLVVAGIEVDDVATAGKTLPDFARRWAQLLEAAR